MKAAEAQVFREDRQPNGLRLSGARKGVRCSRGLGPLGEFTFEPFSQELLE